MTKYYIDACIWRDYLEDRTDKFRPLGEWAFRLIKKIVEEESFIMFSDLVKIELRIAYSEDEIKRMLEIAPPHLLIRLEGSPHQIREAIAISKQLSIPKNDALHAILARDSDATLITRDKHFCELTDRINVKKPEDLI
jgi:predicted nucleic acid-binding protein